MYNRGQCGFNGHNDCGVDFRFVFLDTFLRVALKQSDLS